MVSANIPGGIRRISDVILQISCSVSLLRPFTEGLCTAIFAEVGWYEISIQMY